MSCGRQEGKKLGNQRDRTSHNGRGDLCTATYRWVSICRVGVYAPCRSSSLGARFSAPDAARAVEHAPFDNRFLLID